LPFEQAKQNIVCIAMESIFGLAPIPQESRTPKSERGSKTFNSK